VRLHDLFLKTSAMIILAPDGVTFFAIPWSQTRNLFAPSITEDASNVLMILPLSEDRSNRTLAYARRNDIGYLVVDSVLVSLMII
jgi:hypothetical protein